jgi:hypothetical protein
MLIESSIWIPLALEAPNVYDCFCVFWHVTSTIMALINLQKLSCLGAWLYEKVSFDAILD